VTEAVEEVVRIEAREAVELFERVVRVLSLLVGLEEVAVMISSIEEVALGTA